MDTFKDSGLGDVEERGKGEVVNTATFYCLALDTPRADGKAHTGAWEKEQ